MKLLRFIILGIILAGPATLLASDSLVVQKGRTKVYRHLEQPVKFLYSDSQYIYILFDNQRLKAVSATNESGQKSNLVYFIMKYNRKSLQLVSRHRIFNDANKSVYGHGAVFLTAIVGPDGYRIFWVARDNKKGDSYRLHQKAGDIRFYFSKHSVSAKELKQPDLSRMNYSFNALTGRFLLTCFSDKNEGWTWMITDTRNNNAETWGKKNFIERELLPKIENLRLFDPDDKVLFASASNFDEYGEQLTPTQYALPIVENNSGQLYLTRGRFQEGELELGNEIAMDKEDLADYSFFTLKGKLFMAALYSRQISYIQCNFDTPEPEQAEYPIEKPEYLNTGCSGESRQEIGIGIHNGLPVFVIKETGVERTTSTVYMPSGTTVTYHFLMQNECNQVVYTVDTVSNTLDMLYSVSRNSRSNALMSTSLSKTFILNGRVYTFYNSNRADFDKSGRFLKRSPFVDENFVKRKRFSRGTVLTATNRDLERIHSMKNRMILANTPVVVRVYSGFLISDHEILFFALGKKACTLISVSSY